MCYLKWRNNTEFVSVLDHLEEESNEMIVDNADENDDENIELITTTSSDNPVNTNIVPLPFNVTISSHQQCTVCRVVISSTATICDQDRNLLFIKSNIFIPKGSQCGPGHVVNDRLSIDELNKIRPYTIKKHLFLPRM